MSSVDIIKAYAAPALFLALLAMASYIWSMQQTRIGELELEANRTSNALSTITENQRNSLADRTDFQSATTRRLDQMADTLSRVGENLAALTAIQKAAQPAK